MEFINAVPAFFIEPKNSIADLEKYFAKYPLIFDKYFPMHCPKTRERINQALQKYPESIASIRLINERFEKSLRKVESRISQNYQVTFQNKTHLFVGTYGSNAFVTHDIIGDVFFAAEKLSPIKEHLEIIIAHELGHVTHHLLSQQHEMDFSKVDWWHPLGWLYREGVATFISQKIVDSTRESSYYTYDDLGEEWLKFAKSNESLLKKAFLISFDKGWTDADSKEWFKLRGGKKFGYERLAYYLGTRFVQDLAVEVGESKAITYWVESDVLERVKMWLKS